MEIKSKGIPVEGRPRIYIYMRGRDEEFDRILRVIRYQGWGTLAKLTMMVNFMCQFGLRDA